MGESGTARNRPDATERVMELVMYLLARDAPKTREQIWHDTGLYAPTDATDRNEIQAARTSFERDKALIRNLGVRIRESATADGAMAYTIHPSDYFMPDLGLTAEEKVALSVAAATVDIGETWDLEAVSKMTAEPDTDQDAEIVFAASSVAADIAPELVSRLISAAADRAHVQFVYSGRKREVQPLGMLGRANYWYLAAMEDDIAKTFRLDRVEGKVAVGERGAFARSEIDIASLLPTEPMDFDFGFDDLARVRIDATLARQPTAGRGEVVAEHDDGSVTVEVRVRNRWAFRTWLLEMGRHAVVESPPELVTYVVEWLRAIRDGAAANGRSAATPASDTAAAR